MQLRKMALVLLVVCLLAVHSISKAQGLSGQEIRRFGNGTAQALAWSPDGKQLVVGGTLGLWFFTPDFKLLSHLDNNDDAITAIVWNPNGKQLATASYARKVQLWDIASGSFQTLETTDANTQLHANSTLFVVNWGGSLSFSPDGSRLASASLDNVVKIWESATGKLISTLKMDGPVYTVAWHPKDARIAVGGRTTAKDKYEGFLQIWDTDTGEMRERYSEPYRPPDKPIGPVSVAQWTEGGKSVGALLGTGNGEVIKWIPGGETEQIDGDVGGTGPNGLSYAPGEDLHAVAHSSNIAYALVESCWSSVHVGSGMIPGPGTIGFVKVSGALVGPMTWSTDGRYLALIDGDNNLYVVDKTAKPQDSVQSEIKPLATSTFFARVPDGVSWDAEGRVIYVNRQYAKSLPDTDLNREYLDAVQVKDLLNNETLWEQAGIAGFTARRFALSPARKTLAFVQEYKNGRANAITILRPLDSPSDLLGAVNPLYFDPPAGTIEGQPAEIEYPWAIYWSPDGSRIAASEYATKYSVLAIWDAQTGKLLVFAPTPFDTSLSWSPDGQLLVGGFCGYDISKPPFILDAITGKVLFSLNEVMSEDTCGMAWGPQGRSIAMITKDNQVYIWSTASGKLLQKLPGHTIVWSNKGERLAVATEEQTVQLYNTATGDVTVTLKGAAGKTNSTAFSLDDRRIATADDDGSIRIWDVATGQLLTTLVGHKGPVQWTKWNPDGSQLLSYGDDTTLRLWEVRK